MARGTAVVILGATAGIGRALASHYAAGGHDVVLVGRDLGELGRQATDLQLRHGVAATPVALDARDTASHAGVWARAVEAAEGEPLGVVWCIGDLAEEAEARADAAVAERLMAINLTAAVTLLAPAAAHFEARQTGFICALSSVAGDRGRASNATYGAAKAGLTAYMSGLRQRLGKVGVRVVTIKPGFVDTGMTYGRAGMFLVADPAAVARGIADAIDRDRAVAYVPAFWAGIMAIIRAIPEPVFKRMKL